MGALCSGKSKNPPVVNFDLEKKALTKNKSAPNTKTDSPRKSVKFAEKLNQDDPVQLAEPKHREKGHVHKKSNDHSHHDRSHDHAHHEHSHHEHHQHHDHKENSHDHKHDHAHEDEKHCDHEHEHEHSHEHQTTAASHEGPSE
jgi:hypothetical protein